MRFFADRPDLLTPVRWYFVPADRPTLEIPTVFASKTFEVANREELPLIGEVAARTWNRGNAPHTFDGQHYCGTDQQWLGCLSTDIVDPNCCGIEAPPDATCDLRIGLRLGCMVQTFDGGGVVIDGSGEGRGGVVIDGSGEGRGGVVLDGTGEGRGGVVLGGSGVPPPNPPISSCSNCPDGAWSFYEVVIAGATGGSAVYNGTWPVTHSSLCLWTGPCGPSTVGVNWGKISTTGFLQIVSPHTGTLVWEYRYILPSAPNSWCLISSITADRITSGAGGMPLTITLRKQ